MIDYESRLNDPYIPPEQRLSALKDIMERYSNGDLTKPKPGTYVNNHIHTCYSFSPYTPVGAAYTAWKNGLTTAGIMDHDSVVGGMEFVEAGRLLGIATTVGFECRCSMKGTPFEGRRINNPDQNTVAYLACHGIPHQNMAKAQQWLTPYREKRNLRNRRMVEKINDLLAGGDVPTLDFEKHVLPLSQWERGGSVTERHILYALAGLIIESVGKGRQVAEYLKNHFGIEVYGKNMELLCDPNGSMYQYGLLGVLKGNLVEQFYIDADEECPHVSEFIAFVREIGAISAYAYLGDVGDSVTGDKKAQRFEDVYLGDLVPWLAQAGFDALTYMPARNTPQQLSRLITLCEQNGLFQISGEDINSPTQSFICKALEQEQFRHLVDSTWALIGHELAATKTLDLGMFSAKTVEKMPALKQRIEYFCEYGKSNFIE